MESVLLRVLIVLHYLGEGHVSPTDSYPVVGLMETQYSYPSHLNLTTFAEQSSSNTNVIQIQC